MSALHAIVSSMNNLVPTPRVNKHGDTVIRHMRVDDPPRSLGGIQIPAPQVDKGNSLFHRQRVEELGKRVTSTFMRGGMSMLKVKNPLEMNSHLHKLDAHVVRAFFELIKEAPEKNKERLLIGVLNNGISSDDAGYVLFINKALPDRDDGSWDTRNGGNEEYVGARGIHQGILRYWEDAPTDILRASESDQERVRALAIVTRAVMESDSRGVAWTTGVTPRAMFLTNDEMIALTIENADRAEVIERVIRERKTCNVELVSNYLYADAPSLREGML